MCVFLMADLGETTAFSLPSSRHLSQNRPPAHQNELGTSVGDLPCEACRRFPAGNMRTHVQVSPSQGPAVVFFWPDPDSASAKEIMDNLLWQIPLGTLGLLFLARGILAPYWLYRE